MSRLCQSDGVGIHATNLRHRHVRRAYEAVRDGLKFFTDQRQPHLREQVIALVDRTRDRVLDREHCVVDLPGPERLEHLAKALVANATQRLRRIPEVLRRRELAVRAFAPLVADPQLVLRLDQCVPPQSRKFTY